MRSALLALALVGPIALAQSPEVAIQFSPPTTLPGIPVTILFTFTNSSSKTLPLPATLFLVVTPPRGSAFVADWEGTLGGPLEDFQDKTLPPNKSLTIALGPDGTFQLPMFFTDKRILRPGVYEFQAFVSYDRHLTREELLDPPRIDAARHSSIASNRAVLAVTQPEGQDAEIWAAMQQLGDGGWHPSLLELPRGLEFARDVVKNHSRSRYAPWIAATGVGTTEEERVENLRAVLDHHPHDEMRLWRIWRLAVWERGIAEGHGEINPKERSRYAKRALTRLRELHLRAKDPKLRQLAASALNDFEE